MLSEEQVKQAERVGAIAAGFQVLVNKTSAIVGNLSNLLVRPRSKSQGTSVISTLLERNVFLLWSAGFISVLGDWIMIVTLPFSLYQITHSTSSTGLLVFLQAITRIIFGPFGGVLADRMDRKRMMVISDLARFLILLLFSFAAASGQAWLLYTVAVLLGVFQSFYSPAEQSIIPNLTTKERLVQFNSLISTRNSFVSIGGPLIGGSLFTAMGIKIVSVLDGMSFLLSALLILMIVVRPSEAGANAPRRAKKSVFQAGYWSDLVDGLQMVRKERTIAVLFWIMGIAMFVQGILGAALVPFAYDVLHGGAKVFSYLASTQGIGMLIGGLLMNRLKTKSLPRIISWGVTLSGLIFLIQVNLHNIPMILFLSALFGIPIVLFFISFSTFLQQCAPDHIRGRLFGTYSTVTSISSILGMGLVSLVGNAISVVIMLSICGILYMVSGLIAALYLPKGANSATSETMHT